MTITLELPPELEARFVAEARNKGVPVAEVVRAHLLQQAPAAIPPEQLTAEDVDKAFDEIAAMIPGNIPPVPDEALSRENIYTREDEWNRR